MPDGRQTSPIRPLAERLAAQQTRADEPLVCDSCGSTFFFHIHVYQYSKPTGYMSTELRTLTITPFPIRICLCGNIVPPSGSSSLGAPTERAAFQASLELVQKRRQSGDPKELVKTLASVQELESLQTQVKNLNQRIENLKFELIRNVPGSTVVEPIIGEQLDHAMGDDIAPDRLPTPAPAGKKKKQYHKPKE